MTNPLTVINWKAYEDAVTEAVGNAAIRAAELLKEKLSEEGHGQHWWQMGNPHRSATPDEYPALQYGELADSISFEQVSRNRFMVGSFADINEEGFREAVALEESPPSRGGYQPMQKALHDEDIHDVIMED